METDAEDSCKIKRQKLLPAHHFQSARRLPFAQQTSCTVSILYVVPFSPLVMVSKINWENQMIYCYRLRRKT